MAQGCSLQIGHIESQTISNVSVLACIDNGWIIDLRFFLLSFFWPQMVQGVAEEAERVEKLISGIVRRLESSGEVDIPSHMIGQLVMESLSEIDQVAYVRFASVYRNFREVQDFENFLGELKDHQK